jgi:hypothetical protein
MPEQGTRGRLGGYYAAVRTLGKSHYKGSGSAA